MDTKRFEVFIEDVRQDDDHALVKIDYGAICKADIRYYLGGRDSKVLGLKYPLSLIHEAMGTVLRDRTGKFAQGDKVLLVPNIAQHPGECPGMCRDCLYSRDDLGENYCPNSHFASSNFDGFTKDIISYPCDNLVRINGSEPYYVFGELISVALAAIRRSCLNKDSRVAVYGDGIMGYILCTVIREMYDCNIFAFGKHKDRLDRFSMCDKIAEIDEIKKKPLRFDAAFECVGGAAAASAINSAIDLTLPGGDIVLMGVSEEAAPLDTRMVLQKGLILKGTTRSTVEDFKKAVSLFGNTAFKERIKMLVLDEIKIKCIDDYYLAFETECKNKRLGKYILTF